MIILIIIASAFAAVGCLLSCATANDIPRRGHVWGTGFILCGIVIAIFGAGEGMYRRGQIDALNGKVKFERVQNPDGETVWQERSEKQP